MSVKYYTQFKLTDGDYHGGNEFSGVVELSRPMVPAFASGWVTSGLSTTRMKADIVE